MSDHVVPDDSTRHVHGHHDHGDGHHDEAPHGTLRGYLTGFVLSVILTVIPFWLVMGHLLPSKIGTIAIIAVFGATQMVVHIVAFLHMNTSSEGGWNMLAMIFTLVLVVITLSGSLWVMFHMNENMGRVDSHEMRIAP